MPIEIERKFLIADSSWRHEAGEPLFLRQGYLTMAGHVSVRVRITNAAHASLTVKLPRSGPSRFEFEQPITMSEAESLLALCAGIVIRKERYTVEHAGSSWEIDVYRGRNAGLAVAEIELDAEDRTFVNPPWLGGEITGAGRYQNTALAQQPYREWPDVRKATESVESFA